MTIPAEFQVTMGGITSLRATIWTDGKPGDGGNDEDHEPDEPDPNGV